MAVTVSENVNEAIYNGKLRMDQMQRLSEAYKIANRKFGKRKAQYRIQFDGNNQYTDQNGKMMRTALFIKRVDNEKVFESSQGNDTSQVGLFRFIRDNRG